MKRSHVFRGFAGIFLALLVMFSVVFGVANAWAGKVNELLGTETATITRSLNPDDYYFKSDYASGSELIAAEIAYSTRLAAEGSVALKGEPAISGTRVTLFGMRSGSKMQFGGTMGELIDAGNVVTLGEALTDRGFAVNPEMTQFYKDMEADYTPAKSAGGNVVSDYEDQGSEINEVPASLLDAGKIGDYKDAAIIVLGRDAGESACYYPGANGIAKPEEFTQSPTGNIFSLTNEERDLVNWVEAQGFGKVVVLINSGTSMEVEELRRDAGVDAMLWIGNPGAYGTYGIADLLKGNTLPSGHLPDTWAVNSALSPAAQNLGIYTFDNYEEIETTNNNGLRSSWYLVELEGIYNGYKYYETRYFDSEKGQGNATKAAAGQSTTGTSWNYDSEVSYPFGFGLEGSTFTEEITSVNIDWLGTSTVTVKVTNTGDKAAKHAVQLYVSAPYTDYDKQNGVEKSAVQLIGYAKTGEAKENTFADVVLLNPGESEDVVISFNAENFYSYDRTRSHDGVTGAWILEKGDYYFATGNAHEAVQSVLDGTAYKATNDSDIYKESANGVTIENRLNGADLNNLGFNVTYLSRSDWFGTFPKSVDSLTATAEMITLLRNNTYDMEKAKAAYTGPDSFTYGKDSGVNAIALKGLEYDDPLYDTVLDEVTLQDYINQYIAYFEEIEEIAMPVESRADSPLGIIGYIGQRTKGTIYEVSQDDPAYKHMTDVYPGGPVVAASFSPLLQREFGRLVGNDCLWTGYDTWFGPGMNIHRTPYNLRNIAYYSEDAVLTGNTGANVHKALNKYGVVTNVKHFAFNDQETNRDGLAVFLNEQAARENELRGFEIGIRDGDIKGLMSAFNRIGCTHVGADNGLMNGILRGEWGWNGFMMTDSVKSTAYFLPRETAMAGNDQMLGGSNNAAVWNFTQAEVEKDIVLQSKLRESYHRKLYAYVNAATMNGIDAASAASGGQVWWVVMFEVIVGLSALGFIAFTALTIVFDHKERRQ
ncbi:MAG: glycoside hydrolase family 3 C-terminal domain-containing protein [Oscillospiraceae bacterium]|nr:glycoside hydrolase family 3 C-terminal domain-containing protein [Oscillospiraceae bacterium]